MITFQRKDLKALLAFFLLIACFFGCQNKKDIHTYSATDECNNLKFSVGLLFPKETIELYYNNELILKYLVDSLDGYRFKKDFCIDYKPTGILKIKSFYKDKIYIDTVVNVKKEDFGYHLAVSVPTPVNWKDYFRDGIPIKTWGYLPIDKSIRITKLYPDTAFNNSMVD